MRSQVGPSKGQDLCQRCYEEEKMARKDALQVTRSAREEVRQVRPRRDGERAHVLVSLRGVEFRGSARV